MHAITETLKHKRQKDRESAVQEGLIGIQRAKVATNKIRALWLC